MTRKPRDLGHSPYGNNSNTDLSGRTDSHVSADGRQEAVTIEEMAIAATFGLSFLQDSYDFGSWRSLPFLGAVQRKTR